MDKIIDNLNAFLRKMEIEYRNSLHDTPDWKLNSYLPREIQKESVEFKTQYLIDRFLNKSTIYKMIIDDLNWLNGQSSIDSSVTKKLKIINIDDRLLESEGYTEQKKIEFYQFTDSIRKLVNNEI